MILQDKTVIVSGVGPGLGGEIASCAVRDGARVVIAARNGEKLEDIAKELDDLGYAVDQSNAEYMAAVGAASDRLRMEKIERHPERIAKMMEIQAAQAEALQRIIEREGRELAKFKKLYGIDPTKSSFFTYAAKPDEVSTEAGGDTGQQAGVF